MSGLSQVRVTKASTRPGGSTSDPPGRGPELKTERLDLRPFQTQDLDELHALFTDPTVRRYLLDDLVVRRDWVEQEIAESAARFAAIGCGLWCLREQGAPPIVGFVGYRPFFEPPELQLIYGLLPAWHHRGYATAAAREALRYAFDELGFDEVRAAIDTPNTASIRVLERLGLKRTARSVEGATGAIFFAIDREAWGDGRPT